MTFTQLKQRLAARSAHFSARDYPPPTRRTFAGLDVAIENPAGSVRSGIDRNGKPWHVRMQNDYGYLRRGIGEDGEGLDVFLGPDQSAPNVHIIHQNDPTSGDYDEDKCVLGCRSVDEAKRLYLSNYDDKGPRMYRSCTVIPLASFKQMLTKGQPGGVHWKRKMGRDHETTAMFVAEADTRKRREFPTIEAARAFLDVTHNGHGQIYDAGGQRIGGCRCGGGETVVARSGQTFSDAAIGWRKAIDEQIAKDKKEADVREMPLLKAAAEELWSTAGDMIADGNNDGLSHEQIIRENSKRYAEKYRLSRDELMKLALSYLKRNAVVPNPDEAVRRMSLADLRKRMAEAAYSSPVFAVGNSTFTAFSALNDATRASVESFMREAAIFATDSLGFDAGEPGHWLNFKSDEDTDDVWKTIGAKPGPDGKRHGGTHVLVKESTGEIEKGPKKFVHKKVDELPSSKPKPLHTMQALRERLERGVVGQKPGMVGLQRKPGQPVPVEKEVAAFAPLGNVTLPTHEGKLDPHLEDAYRRAAGKQGFELGAFKVNPETGLASADVSKVARGLPQPAPKAPRPPAPIRPQSSSAASAEKHPLYDRSTGATIPTEDQVKAKEQAAAGTLPEAAQPAGQAASAATMPGAAAPAGAMPAAEPSPATVAAPHPLDFPHQHTLGNFIEAHKADRSAKGLPIIASEAAKQHEQAVSDALKQGQHVPPEVLSEYAHLQPPHAHQKAELSNQVAAQADPPAAQGGPAPVQPGLAAMSDQQLDQHISAVERSLQHQVSTKRRAAPGDVQRASALHEERQRRQKQNQQVKPPTGAEIHAKVQEIKARSPGISNEKAVVQARKELGYVAPPANPTLPRGASPAMMAARNAQTNAQANAGANEPAGRPQEPPAPVASGAAAPASQVAQAQSPAPSAPQSEVEREYGLMQDAYRRGDMTAFQQHQKRAYDLDVAARVGEHAEAETAKKSGRQPKTPKPERGRIPPSKAAIQEQLLEAYLPTAGDEATVNAQEFDQHHNPTTFLNKLPGEISQFLEGRAHLRKMFRVTNDPAQAGGEDAMSAMGERYFGALEGAGQSQVNKALEFARKSPDPGLKFLAALHDTLPTSAAGERPAPGTSKIAAENAASQQRAKNTEMVSPEKLTMDTAGTVNGIPVHVTEDEEGTPILKDGAELPETPVAALHGEVPFDRGSLHKQEPEVGENPFGEVMNEPEPEKPAESNPSTPTAASETPAAPEAAPAPALTPAEPDKGTVPAGSAEAVTPPAAAEDKGPQAEPDLSRQLGLYAKDAAGNPVEVGERPGQASLFNPNKYKAAEKAVEEKVKPQFNPAHTGKLFPSGSGGSSLGDKDSVLPHGSVQVARRHFEPVTNLLKSESFRQHGLRGLDAPSQRMVMASVVNAIHDPKIFDAVVKGIPVDVVDDLRSTKLSPDMLLHHQDVFVNKLPENLKSSVSTGTDIASTLANNAAGIVAKMGAVSPKMSGLPIQHLPASSAGDQLPSSAVATSAGIGTEKQSGLVHPNQKLIAENLGPTSGTIEGGHDNESIAKQSQSINPKHTAEMFPAERTEEKTAMKTGENWPKDLSTDQLDEGIGRRQRFANRLKPDERKELGDMLAERDSRTKRQVEAIKNTAAPAAEGPAQTSPAEPAKDEIAVAKKGKIVFSGSKLDAARYFQKNAFDERANQRKEFSVHKNDAGLKVGQRIPAEKSSPVESLKQKIAAKKSASPVAAVKQQIAAKREFPAINKWSAKQLHDRIEYLQNRGSLNAEQSRELAELRDQYTKVGQQTMRPIAGAKPEQPIIMPKAPLPQPKPKPAMKGISRAPTIAPSDEPTGGMNNPAAAGEWTEIDPRTGRHTPEGMKRAQANLKAGQEARDQIAATEDQNAIYNLKRRYGNEGKAGKDIVPPDGWKSNLIKTRIYAGQLGIHPEGKTQEQLQAEIGKKLEGSTDTPVEQLKQKMGEETPAVSEVKDKISDQQAEKEFNEAAKREAVKEKLGQSEPQAPASASRKLADKVADLLNDPAGKPIPFRELYEHAKQAGMGSLAEGTASTKDLYDAMELGVNRHVLNDRSINASADLPQAEQSVQKLEGLLDRLPTQTWRNKEQQSLQQFSTPPHYAFAAAWLANLKPTDTLLEPSAGTGSLAVHGIKAGAQTIANELSPRRADLLKELGVHTIHQENAEQIGKILHGKAEPSVVVMNPPFSQTAGRMGDKKVLSTAATHIQEAMSLLPENGRLVAIVGRGMSPDSPTFKRWFEGMKQKYNLRANVAVSGDVYKKYGTSFGTRVLVFDKNQQDSQNPVVGEAENVVDLMRKLEGVRNDRPTPDIRTTGGEQSANQSSLQGQAPAGGRIAQPKPLVPPATGAMGGAATGTGSGPQVPARSEARRSAEPSEATHGGVVSRPGAGFAPRGGPAPTGSALGGTEHRRGPDAGSGTRVSQPAGETPVTPEAKAVAQSPNAPAANPPAATLPPDPGEHREATTPATLKDSIYEDYRPAPVLPGAQRHPTKLVESAAMSAVAPPKASYKPNLPEHIIKHGLLSDAQLEPIAYAGQAHSEMLPEGKDEKGNPVQYRRGMFVGDGTGVGKGRIAAGILHDNWNSGRKKGVWISKNFKLLQDATRDWTALGGKGEHLINHQKIKLGQPIEAKEGILYTGYGTLKTKLEDPRARVKQIADWLGPDFDGPIIFDESHAMKGAMPMKGARGMTKASATAQAGIMLQKLLPKARVTYLSATGATEVSNLGYAQRLGLWGPGSEFADGRDFATEISAAGTGGMELVAQGMKQQGAYLARQLSYDGVKQEKLVHNLTPDQRKSYDKLCEGWQTALKNINAALEITAGRQKADGSTAVDKNAKSAAMSAFWGANQRFFSQVLTSMQMPSIIKDIEQQLADGKSAVVQLVNTNQASQERALAAMEDPDELEELDLTPRDQLMQMVKNCFPVQQHEEYVDEEGGTRMRPVVNAQGEPVENPEAVKMRDNLLAELQSVRVPDGPLEMLHNHFGHQNVSEVTGRTRRVVRVPNPTGGEKMEVQPWGEAKALADANAFQAGKKRILVFSNAGGTGASYHADKNAENQQQRVHYLAQPGWVADTAVQGFGRTHRSGEVNQPVYKLVHTDLNGQKRFISTIARRLDQLGALTRGQRQAGSQGMFDEMDNLESKHAQDALSRLVKDISDNKVEGMSLKEFQNQTGLQLEREDKRGKTVEVPPIPQFLNRLLAMKIDTQNKVFDEFMDRFQDALEVAKSTGQLDVGMETFRADSIKKKSENVVYTDPRSGAQTKHVTFDVKQPIKRNTFATTASGKGVEFKRNKETGRIYAFQPGPTRTDPRSGRLEDTIRRITPTNKELIKPYESDHNYDSQKWEDLSGPAAEQAWNEQLEKSPTHRMEEKHMLVGSILPIWKKVAGKAQVQRLQTDDGERHLGRVIPNEELENTLKRLGVSVTAPKVSGAEAHGRILNNGERLKLSDGWTVKPVHVAGEKRIEVTGPDFSHWKQLERAGAKVERQGYQTRVFVPTGANGGDVLQRILEMKPVEAMSQGKADFSANPPPRMTIVELKRMLQRREVAHV